MEEYEKIVVTAAIGFACGIASAVLLEKWRDRRVLRRAVLQDYLVLVGQNATDTDEYRRFAALQKAGAWKLNQRELESLADDVRGRGWKHPYEAWTGAFSDMSEFPREFLLWAKESGVDLSDADAAAAEIAKAYDTGQLPKPNGPRILIW
jgi:hypothetical protein